MTHPFGERGIDRSIPYITDPLPAFFVEGYFAGYARSGSNTCPYDVTEPVQSKAWIDGYVCGLRTRISIVGQSLGR